MKKFAKIVEIDGYQVLGYVDKTDEPKLVIITTTKNGLLVNMALSYDGEDWEEKLDKNWNEFESIQAPNFVKTVKDMVGDIDVVDKDGNIVEDVEDDNLIDNPRNCSCGNSLGWDGLNEVWFCECTKLFHNDNGEVGKEFTEEEYELEEVGDDDLDEVIYESEEDIMELIDEEVEDGFDEIIDATEVGEKEFTKEEDVYRGIPGVDCD